MIQVIEVPLDDPAAAHEIAEPPINYPGDPDNQIDWTERNLVGPGLEPAARACHDIVVHVEHRLAGAACAEQGQVWEIDANGIPDTANPISIIDDDSEFQVGDLRPDPAPSAYCSAHMGMVVMGIQRDLLVNAWYTGGVDVIDFTNPTRLREIAFYDIAGPGPAGSDNWSAYPYQGPRFRRGPGVPIYASDGVHTPDSARGLVVFQPHFGRPARTFDHLNPQTMD